MFRNTIPIVVVALLLSGCGEPTQTSLATPVPPTVAEPPVTAAPVAETSPPPEPLAFKEVALNTSATLGRARKNLRCYKTPDAEESDFACKLPYGGAETVAGIPVTSLELWYFDDRLGAVSIGFDSLAYDRIEAAMVERWGVSRAGTDRLSNAFGATYSADSRTWIRPDGHMTIQEHAGSLDSGAIYIMADWYMEAVRKKRSGAAKKASSDL